MSSMGRVPWSAMHTPHAQLDRRATWCSSLHVSHVTDLDPAVTGVRTVRSRREHAAGAAVGTCAAIGCRSILVCGAESQVRAGGCDVVW